MVIFIKVNHAYSIKLFMRHLELNVRVDFVILAHNENSYLSLSSFLTSKEYRKLVFHHLKVNINL